MTIQATDSRKVSAEGFLLADAVIAKVGPLDYTRGELRLDGDPMEKVTLDRPRRVLEAALPSMVGAPLTRGHPKDFVNDSNFRNSIIGAVATEPRIDDEGNVRASVRIYDRSAVDGVHRGEHQLSPGFQFVPAWETRDRGTIKDAMINHIALLPRGRAGESVRILDHLPEHQSHPTRETSQMDEQKQLDTIRLAVKDALGGEVPKGGLTPQEVEDRIVKAVDGALKPVVEDLAQLKAKDAKSEADEQVRKAEDAVNARIKEAVDAERARLTLVSDAKPFIAEDKHAGLDDMKVEDVLRLAIGDSVPGTDKMDAGALGGAFAAIKATRKATDTGDKSAEATRSVVVEKETKAQDQQPVPADIAQDRFNKARGLEA